MVDFSSADNDVTILPDGRTQKYRGKDLGNLKGLAEFIFLKQKRILAFLMPNQDVTSRISYLRYLINEGALIFHEGNLQRNIQE